MPPSNDDQERSRAKRTFAAGLGQAIKVLRAERSLSRRDLAERSGISYSYLAEIENGAKSPASGALDRLAAGLEMPIHELVKQAEAWTEEAGPGASGSKLRHRDGSRSSGARSREARSLREEDLGDFANEPPQRVSAMRVPPAATRAIVPRTSLGEFEAAALDAETETRPVIPGGLVDEIQAGNCVAFVGAGFSAAADLPGWKILLTEIAENDAIDGAVAAHVAGCVEQGTAHTLDEAAQVLEDRLGRERFLERLDDLVGHPAMTGAIAQRVRWLRGIPFRTILTTNFDGVLDGATTSHGAYRDALRPDAYRWWDQRYWDESEGAYTLKLHGDVSASGVDDDSLVLTRRDYRRRLYEDPAYATFLRAVMATTTVLYMGFSFEDAYLNELRSEILALLSQDRESAPVAYAIVNDVSAETSRHFSRHEGIEILSYGTHGGTDFGGFDRTLEAIYTATNPLLRFSRYLERKRILWVDPHPENNELAFEHLADAAREAGSERAPLVTVSTADEGLHQLEAALGRGPFDLVITHWGDNLAVDEIGRSTSTAERLLGGIRTRKIRCPVVVFGFAQDLEHRKRTALGLGAQAYCSHFETLFQVIERVLAPGDETA
jgi:transcriptional regulator with XRE-family HTH domain/CheY-like chemotaxis protein